MTSQSNKRREAAAEDKDDHDSPSKKRVKMADLPRDEAMEVDANMNSREPPNSWASVPVNAHVTISLLFFIMRLD